MKRLAIFPAVVAIAFCLSMIPAFAQHGGGRPSGAGAPTPGGAWPGNAGPNVNRGVAGPGDSFPSHDTQAPHNQASLSHDSPSDALSHNTAIAGKISTLTGEDAQTACNGFKNLGECVAAAHVAKNLSIPGGFDALKAKTTGTDSVSLGKAIQQLDPNADAKAESKKANKQAKSDLKPTT
jgi:hypothetical protein